MWLVNWIEINLESVLSHSEFVLIHIKSVNQSGDYQCQSDNENNEKLKQIVSIVINGKMIWIINFRKMRFSNWIVCESKCGAWNVFLYQNKNL